MKYSSILIAFFTTLVQCYDYALFGLAAAILSKSFFPEGSNEEQLINFFKIFSAAVVMKPVGAIIFGKIADKYGRISSVKIASALGALSTAVIGLTPTFETIGLFATIILTICRMTFLMSLAGEINTTRIYVAEKTGKYKNFANGILSFCSQSGALIAASSYHYAISSQVPDIWRINFIAGGIFGILIISMRHYFQESEEFLKYRATHPNKVNDTDDNILQIILAHRYKFLVALLISGCAGGIYHFSIIFFGTFASEVVNILSQAQVKSLNETSILAYSIAALISGLIADKFSPFIQILLAIILSFVVAIAVQYIFIKDLNFSYYIISILTGLMPFYTVPLHILTQSLFAVEVRVRMCSLSHAIGGMVFSSTTPLICMQIWHYSHSLNFIFGYVIVLITVMFSSVLSLRKMIRNY